MQCVPLATDPNAQLLIGHLRLFVSSPMQRLTGGLGLLDAFFGVLPCPMHSMPWVGARLKPVEMAAQAKTGITRRSNPGTMQSAVATVQFCPMLSVLFIATRMRASEATHGKGAPQGWAQDAMLLATYAGIGQLLMAVFMPIGSPKPPEVDADGNVRSVKPVSTVARTFGTSRVLTRYAFLLALCSGILIACFSVFVPAPSTANGKGSLLSDGDPSNNFFPQVPPLSTHMECVINLAAQCFLNGVDSAKSAAVKALEMARDSVTYAPMLCVLFVVSRMCALQLTSAAPPGTPRAPPQYCQDAMRACATAVLIQAVMVLFVPILTWESLQKDADGNVVEGAPGQMDPIGRMIGLGLTAVRYLAMVMPYGGLATVCYCAMTMKPEDCMADQAAAKAMWTDGTLPVPPALATTRALSIQFFAVCLALFVVKTVNQFANSKLAKFETIFAMAAYTMNFCAMLCLLFIGVRLRALEIDPKAGAPQPSDQKCFYLCAGAVLFQTVLTILMPLLGAKAKPEKNEGAISIACPRPLSLLNEGEIEFEVSNKVLAIVPELLKYASMFASQMAENGQGEVMQLFVDMAPPARSAERKKRPERECVGARLLASKEYLGGATTPVEKKCNVQSIGRAGTKSNAPSGSLRALRGPPPPAYCLWRVFRRGVAGL